MNFNFYHKKLQFVESNYYSYYYYYYYTIIIIHLQLNIKILNDTLFAKIFK